MTPEFGGGDGRENGDGMQRPSLLPSLSSEELRDWEMVRIKGLLYEAELAKELLREENRKRSVLPLSCA